MAVRRAFHRRRRIRHGKAKRVRHWEPREDPETLHEPVKTIVAPALDRVRFAYGSMRQAILERDKYRCRYCGGKVTDETANIDHVVPYDKNGQTKPANLVTCCRDCNKAKGNNIWRVDSYNMGKRTPRRRKYRQSKRSSEPAASPSGVERRADANIG